jgi:hypothetical protein
MIIQLRKMKCTPDADGCACCRVLNLPCRVTDRVTGETFVRGAAGKMILLIDNLNKMNGDLKQANELLKQQNAEKERTYQNLESQFYGLRSQYLDLRDELEQERRKNNSFSDQFAYEVRLPFQLCVSAIALDDPFYASMRLRANSITRMTSTLLDSVNKMVCCDQVTSFAKCQRP